MNIPDLTRLFEGAIKYHLKVRPATHVRVTQGDKWLIKAEDDYLKSYDLRKGRRSFNRKMQLVRANEHAKELAFTCKKDGFDLKGGNYIIVFMRHMPKTWKKGVRKPGKRDLMAWKPMKTKPDVDNYFKKLTDSLMREDSEIWCAAIMKLWIPDEVPEGTFFINVPEFFEFVVEYLKETLTLV